MDVQELKEKLRIVRGLRVGDHTARYVLAQLASSPTASFPVLANDARTGLPVNLKLTPADVREAAQPTLF